MSWIPPPEDLMHLSLQTVTAESTILWATRVFNDFCKKVQPNSPVKVKDTEGQNGIYLREVLTSGSQEGSFAIIYYSNVYYMNIYNKHNDDTKTSYIASKHGGTKTPYPFSIAPP